MESKWQWAIQFRVPFTSLFKTRLIANLSCNWAVLLSCKSNSISLEQFHTKTQFQKEAESNPEWPTGEPLPSATGGMTTPIKVNSIVQPIPHPTQWTNMCHSFNISFISVQIQACYPGKVIHTVSKVIKHSLNCTLKLYALSSNNDKSRQSILVKSVMLQDSNYDTSFWKENRHS